MNNVVYTKNLTKKYKFNYALKDFNITINKGDIYGLIGVNGAGKSTLIKIIAGITEQTSGELSLFDNQYNMMAARSKIGAIIENPSFYPNLSATENLMYYATVLGIKNTTIVKELLIKVKLDPASKQPFKQFSLGMKQRLGIAFALLNNPEFIILDEPTNGLDPVGILELRDVIATLNQQGVTFLICSHILSELSQIATKYGIVHKGKFIKEFTNNDINQLTQDTVEVKAVDTNIVKAFLDDMNYEYNIKDDIFIITIQNINEFMKHLVENEVSIISITQNKTSLEDIFLSSIKEATV